MNYVGALQQFSGFGAGLGNAVAIFQRLVAEAVEVGQRINDALEDLGLDAVVVVLGALREDVFDAAGLARVEQTIPVEVVRLEKFYPGKSKKRLA